MGVILAELAVNRRDASGWSEEQFGFLVVGRFSVLVGPWVFT